MGVTEEEEEEEETEHRRQQQPTRHHPLHQQPIRKSCKNIQKIQYRYNTQTFANNKEHIMQIERQSTQMGKTRNELHNKMQNSQRTFIYRRNTSSNEIPSI